MFPASTYPATLRFELSEALIKSLVTAALEMGLPFELDGTGLTVVVYSPQEAYDLGTRTLAVRRGDQRSGETA